MCILYIVVHSPKHLQVNNPLHKEKQKNTVQVPTKKPHCFKLGSVFTGNLFGCRKYPMDTNIEYPVYRLSAEILYLLTGV